MSARPDRKFINTVPADQYGLWCQHGKHLLVVDPNDHSDYPGCVPVDPWPCENCTLAQVQDDLEEEAARYEYERWNEWRNSQ